MSIPRSARASLVMILASTGLAAAQTQQPAGGGPVQQAATAATAKESGLSVDLRGRGSFTFSGDIDDTDGDVSIGRAGFGVNLGMRVWERSQISLGLDGEVSWYMFEDAAGLISTFPGDNDPFELMLTTTISPRLSVQHDEKWGWFVGGIIQFSGEPDADIGDSGTYGGFGGARYTFSDKFSMSLGLAAKSQLEDDVLVIPLIGIEWKVTDRVTVSNEGTLARIMAKVSEEWSLGISGGWEMRDYRLDDEGSLADGAVSDSRVPVALEVVWSPSPRTSISLTGGVVVWQEFEFRDSDGNELDDRNTDPTGFVGVSARFSF